MHSSPVELRSLVKLGASYGSLVCKWILKKYEEDAIFSNNKFGNTDFSFGFTTKIALKLLQATLKSSLKWKTKQQLKCRFRNASKCVKKGLTQIAVV